VSPTGPAFSSDGLRLSFSGNLVQSHTFPSDPTLAIPALQYSSQYDMHMTGGVALWLELSTDSSGTLQPGQSSTIPFVARDPGIFGWRSIISRFQIYSSDPIDSIKRIIVARDIMTDVGSSNTRSPVRYALKQNYPNPFNPTTTIRYQLPSRSYVTLTVYDLLGRKVGTLVDGVEEPGEKSTTFDGSSLASGVYFYRLKAGEFVQTRKLVLVR
jgi:hypothetical protein